MDPASAQYVIGAPFFDFISLDLDQSGSRKISVIAKGASEGMKYVRSVSVDGKERRGITISHEELMSGAEIVFEMSHTPGGEWGR